MAFSSNITFKGNFKFSRNQKTLTTGLQEGGALTLVQSKIFLDGTCSFEHNHAENGGAILSIESNLYVIGNVTVAHNTASKNGGGVYLIESKIISRKKSMFLFLNNIATHRGGGLHAISSLIKAVSILEATQVCTAILNFTSNIAERGGGLSLEANAKLVVLKYEYGNFVFGSNFSYEQVNKIIFCKQSKLWKSSTY